MSDVYSIPSRDLGPRRLTVELTNTCNLHCSYCLRDDDALHHAPVNFMSVEFFESLLKQAKQAIGIAEVTFTGGEPTLHPKFGEILALVAENGLRTSFVTNGWNFEKLWPKLVAHRDSVTHVAFSLDGPTREDHDRWRGDGSFVRVVRAFSLCFAGALPFVVKVGIRRDTFERLELIALFAARMGAAGLSFGHVMPTSTDVEDCSSLSLAERQRAELEIANLARIFKMKIGIDVGYANLDPRPPCSPLAGLSGNVDYQGRLSVCCNLSGFRGGVGEEDVAADLNEQDFATAYAALSQIQGNMLKTRERRLSSVLDESAIDLYTASPCLLCLDTFGKLPWRQTRIQKPIAAKALPVLGAI
jgi:MoaA/NifB/PqqE/SkfB family radical SAM enzyme